MIIASRTYNSNLVREILLDPEINERISDDSHADIDIDVNKDCWVKMEVEGDLVGVYRLHALNRWTVQIHAHVFAKHRDNHAFDTGKAILRWFIDTTDYLKIVAEIPECYPDVVKFTQKFGFRIEGFNRQSRMKEGKLIDQIWLGITRSEIEGGL